MASMLFRMTTVSSGHLDTTQAGMEPVMLAVVVVVASLLGLLFYFLGEVLDRKYRMPFGFLGMSLIAAIYVCAVTAFLAFIKLLVTCFGCLI